ncbi:MAG: fibronectin type III domain-containing protein [Eubacterium sp.]|nr:fibronectin type III domain-containing protein [Eubacterium sp.]
MKRIIAFFMALIMTAALLPVSASAAGKTEVYDYYSKSGEYKVSSFTYKVSDNDFTYKVWFPKNIQKLSRRPIIIYCNGTGSNYEKSQSTVDFLERAASHGYVCLCNTDTDTGMGTSMDAGFTKLIELGKDGKSKLYKKLDLSRVGAAGHSQGATCTIHLTDPAMFENAKYYKAIFMASLPTPALENSPIQNCPYDPTTVTLPTLLIGGTGATDASFIAPWDTSLLPNYQAFKGDTYLARMKGVEHADSIEKTASYMIAWFDYQFYGKSIAAKAFTGKYAELKTNPNWQDFKVKIKKRPCEAKNAKALRKGFKATWKVDKRVTGYQIKYAYNKSFKNKKNVTVKGGKKAAYTVKKLKAEKTVYIRVRAYTVVGNKKFYSKWSKLMTVKTK